MPIHSGRLQGIVIQTITAHLGHAYITELVARRHYNFGHGIGRSGNLTESQPKAAGTNLMADITNSMLLGLVRLAGIKSAKQCLLVPMATGMTMMLVLLALKASRPTAKYVIWSRIDQKSCFKSILTAGLIPVVVDTIPANDGDSNGGDDDSLCTNVAAFEQHLLRLGADNVVCLLTTTSCFAPRVTDDLSRIAALAATHNVPHVVNNAYGLQNNWLCAQIQNARSEGRRIDLVVQSTDKNLLVPVGGAIVFGFDRHSIETVASMYAGRASGSQTLDVFMTLLSVGRHGYSELINQQRAMFDYLRNGMDRVATGHGERVCLTRKNPISVALTLTHFAADTVTSIGSMLFTRGVSGARVVSPGVKLNVGGHEFENWGCHGRSHPSNTAYLTAAAALGVTKPEVDRFLEKLNEVLGQTQTQKQSH